MKLSVSIVIPNYNGEELLKNNLPDVVRAAMAYDSKTEIIVVDDGSTDASVSEIKRLKFKNKNFGLVENNRNMGFARAVNTGVTKAKGDIVVLLNTDVNPEVNFLELLLPHFGDEKMFAVGCLDKSIEGNKIVMRGRGIGWWERGLVMHKKGAVGKTDTFWVSGGSAAYRKSVWDSLGGMDELYKPFYWEDIDLSYRARKAGYKVLFEPKSIVMHAHSEGTIKSSFSDAEVKPVAYRNQLLFVWKNITDLRLIISHVIWLPYHLLKSIIRRDYAFGYGLLSAIRRIKKVVESRKKSKASAIHNDKEILTTT